MLRLVARRGAGVLRTFVRDPHRLSSISRLSAALSFSEPVTLRRHSAIAAAEILIDIEDTEDLAGELDSFDLCDALKLQLRRAGVTQLFPVQRQCFDLVMSGRDMMCKSRTGSGKTLAFAIPIVESLRRQDSTTARRAAGRAPRALVLAPTRELAKQVEREFARIDPTTETLSVYGGTPQGPQLAALRRGVDVVVGTPGRVIDHLQQGSLKLAGIKFVVLDEADMMLQMGFQEDVETILSYLPAQRQTMLWSATMPRWVLALSRRYLNQPEFIDLVGEDSAKIPTAIYHLVAPASPDTRQHILALLARYQGAGKRVIVFTQTKTEVDEIAALPALRSTGAAPLHGGLSQQQREATLRAFHDGRIRLLVATDVAARGLDIPAVDMVVHYRLPRDPEAFVHRTGRTGRAGRSGTNVTLLASPMEEADYAALERDFGFEATRIGWPPSLTAAAAATAAATITNEIVRVPTSSVTPYMLAAGELASRFSGKGDGDPAIKMFNPSAFRPTNAGALHALGAAMALLGAAKVGSGGGPGDAFSLIDGRRGRQTVWLRGTAQLRSAADLKSVLQEINPGLMAIAGIPRRAQEGVVFDLPPDAAAEFVQRVSESGKGWTAEMPEAIPNRLESLSGGSHHKTHRYTGAGTGESLSRRSGGSRGRGASSSSSSDGCDPGGGGRSRGSSRGGSSAFGSGSSGSGAKRIGWKGTGSGSRSGAVSSGGGSDGSDRWALSPPPQRDSGRGGVPW